ncbi:MAG: transposase [Armatimonadota bacterium]
MPTLLTFSSPRAARAGGLAREESQAAWEAVLAEARTAGLIDRAGAPFVATDGKSGLLAALAMELPRAIVQRCVWHIGYRTRKKIRKPGTGTPWSAMRCGSSGRRTRRRHVGG